MKYAIVLMKDCFGNFFLTVPTTDWKYSANTRTKSQIDFSAANDDFVSFIEKTDRWFQYDFNFRKYNLHNWFNSEFLKHNNGYIFVGVKEMHTKDTRVKKAESKRVNVNLAVDLLKRIDDHANALGITRTRAIEALIEEHICPMT